MTDNRKLAMNRVQRPRRLGRAARLGQSLVVFSLTALLIFASVGLAVDAGVAYVAANRVERAAAAAALAGVTYMPGQVATAKSAGLKASSRNGYTDGAANNVHVNVYPVPKGCDASGSTTTCIPNRLGASVSVDVGTTFTRIVGFGTHTVTQSATAEYLPSLTLGQPGSSIGSTPANLNTAGNYYFLRTEGWGTPRTEGDAYTPNDAGTSTDIHTLNSNTEVNMTNYAGSGFGTLPSNGGYSFQVVVPTGASGVRLNVFNPAFMPNSSNNYKESDSSFNNSNSTLAQYDTMEYTLFQVQDVFDHSKDIPLSQMIVNPVNATATNPNNGNADTTKFWDTRNSAPSASTPCYAYLDANTVTAFYQNWIDPTASSYTDTETASGASGGRGCSGSSPSDTTHLVTINKAYNTDLGAGTYRLRVDTLDGNAKDGSTSTVTQNAGGGHKGYALRVMSGNSACSTCTIGGLNEFAFYTPFTVTVPKGQSSATQSFDIPVVQVPPSYAGQTIDVYAYDPGDTGGTNYLSIINPVGVNGTTAGGSAIASNSGGISIYDLGPDRSTPVPSTTCGSTPCQLSVGNGNGQQQSSTQARIETASGGSNVFNGHWILFKIPIPSNYNPTTTASQYWSLRYELTTTSTATATDTLTLAVGFDGPPVHLVP